MINVILFFYDKISYSLYTYGELANDSQEIFRFQLKKKSEDMKKLPIGISPTDALDYVEEIGAKLNCTSNDILAVFSEQDLFEEDTKKNMVFRPGVVRELVSHPD